MTSKSELEWAVGLRPDPNLKHLNRHFLQGIFRCLTVNLLDQEEALAMKSSKHWRRSAQNGGDGTDT